jgi:prepilin-type N-terminal cleavage/methylation domain-containing protein
MLAHLPTRFGQTYHQILSRNRRSGRVTPQLTNSKGFTLTELMIVTVLIGIVAAVGGPEIVNQMAKYRIQGATRQLGWELMVARVQAINQNRNVIVEFPNNHEYAIGPDMNNNNVLDVGEGKTKDIQSSYNDVIFAATTNFIFTSKGTANHIANMTLSGMGGSKNILVTIAGVIKMN